MIRRAARLVVVGSLLLGLSACGNRLTKEQLIADNLTTDRSVSNESGDPPATEPVAGETDPTTGVASRAAPLAQQESQRLVRVSPTGDPSRKTSAAGPTNRVGTPALSTAVPACAIARSEIAIGTVGGQSGVIGAAVRAGTESIKAWVADINSRGGLACHPVKYYVADDGGDPAKNAALTEQMIVDRKVIAMVFSSNPLSAQGGRPVLERAHVPTIGSEGGDDYFNTSPDFFPVAPSGSQLMNTNYAMLGQQLTADQKAHLGVLTCLEAAVCSTYSTPAGKEVAARYGLKVVYSAGSTLVQPDYTSNCQNAKSAGVKALFIVSDGGMTSRTIRSCNKIGFKPQVAASPVAMSGSVADLPEMEGVLLPTSVKPWTGQDPITQRYLAALAKYVPGARPQGSGSIGWVVALMLEKVGANLPDQPTPRDVYEGLWRIKDFDFGGYTVPLTYAREKPAAYPVCWWTMQITNREWTSPDDGKRGCSG